MKRRYETKLGHNAHRQQYQHLKLKLKREHFLGEKASPSSLSFHRKGTFAPFGAFSSATSDQIKDDMPNNPPMLVTRVHVGKGPGIVLISMATPSGELGKGPVENVEAVRVAMTYSTFKEVAELFNFTAAEIQAAEGTPLSSGRPNVHAMAGSGKN
jgi:hypothetical protein